MKRHWVLCLFEDLEHKYLFKQYSFNTISDLANVINQKEQTCSNFYHGLIKPRDIFEYVAIYQTDA
jgi:hypothetical protein